MNKVKIIIYAFLFATIMFFVTGCNRGKIINVYEQDYGKIFEINVNDTLKLNLPSNPSTGYAWVPNGNTGIVLKDLGTYQFASNAGNDVVGADGIQTLSFKAIKTGEDLVTLVYAHPWEVVDGTYEYTTYSTFVLFVRVK
jgi:inhibitor of cysteine peptidase